MARAGQGAGGFDPSEHTPVMQQFFQAKAQYPDALLFFRMGDFYELFYEDAIVASDALEITLTSRGKDKRGENIPMAGVPHHASANYLARLLEKGFKVAICEQLADPKSVKGIVPRGVTRVATPGLTVDPDSLDEKTDNLLLAIEGSPSGGFGVAALEMSRADLRACALEGAASLLAEVARCEPREVLLLPGVDETVERAIALVVPRAALRRPAPSEDARLSPFLPDEEVERATARLSAESLAAAGEVLAYAQAARPGSALRLTCLVPYDPAEGLVLDEVAVRNLELVRTLSGEKRGSLLSLLDETKTAMGARLLRRRLLAPLTDRVAIQRRLDAVEALVADAALRDDIRGALGPVRDLERLATRVELGVAHPRDLAAIRQSLIAVDDVARRVDDSASGSTDDALESLAPKERCEDVLGMLETALTEEPPLVSNAGGIFASGVSPELDELRALRDNAKDVLLALEQRERERTGITSLKVKFTKVFGYYLEVTRSNLHLVPDDYRRKQTIANGERYVTDELDELQAKILNADERIRALEAELFAELVAQVAACSPRLRALAEQVANLDVAASLAEVAHRYDYRRPRLEEDTRLELAACRHPIVERLAEAGTFVPNDVTLDVNADRLMIITGPNMAGKSTTMRQVALSVILAQMGSFVPAKEARIGLVDRVFTRVGASDDLGRGQSTFMVEMRETATILRDATERSLVVLDEVGRGTSTYDGLAIAWAIAEHLHDAVRCRTMFATHYHELCELAALKDGVVSYNVAAREYGDDVVFLHKLTEGATNKSYGIAVARLAGVTEIVLARARAILRDLEDGSPLPGGHRASLRQKAQLDLFGPPPAAREPSDVERTLAELDVDRLRPVDALLVLSRLKEMVEAT